MKRKSGMLWSILLLSLASANAQPDADGSRKIWVDHESEYEDLLLNAEIVSIEDVGMGVTEPRRAELKAGDREVGAVFKPIKRGRHKGYWESYEAEIAAYVVDKMIGLNMVPPTVKRRIESNLGSLQLWVEDCKLYKEVEGQAPRTAKWNYQLSRMKMFDVLINNEDRNAQNFLVDPEFNVILIDHSRAFITSKKMMKSSRKLPTYYDRKIVEKLKVLTREQLDAQLEDLLMGGQIKAILERRDALLEHLAELIKERGEAGVLFN
jgi:hypothetical protein